MANGFQQGDAVIWFGKTGRSGGMVREVYASVTRVVGPNGYGMSHGLSYLVDSGDGVGIVKSQAELMPA